MTSPLAVLVPVKGFHLAKQRLAPTVGPEERAALAQAMATTVVASARGLPTFVVTSDPIVTAWAAKLGIAIIADPGGGLNPAIHAGRDVLTADFDRLLIAHADLPRATDLRGVDAGGVTIVPDRERRGTNVLCLPTAVPFIFQFGPDSYDAHRAEALRLGMIVTSHFDQDLALDIDHPTDLAELRKGAINNG